jgi:pimeloyl-ACP methyl ester carboxylesterase
MNFIIKQTFFAFKQDFENIISYHKFKDENKILIKKYLMKNKWFNLKKGIFIIPVILFVFLILPLLIPYPDGEFTGQQLSDPDSRFININGILLHYKIYGNGNTVFILLHGTLTTTFTWHEIIDPLSKIGTVIVYDRPSFGLTSRPVAGDWKGSSPYGYEAQADIVISLMDKLKLKQAVLIGNSMGGAIAMITAEKYPERIKALVLVDPVQNRHALPSGLRILAAAPQFRRVGPLFIHYNIKKFGVYLYPLSYHDTSKIKQEYYNEYFKILKIKNFERGLWELLVAARPFEDILNPGKITTPTLIIAGDDDRVAGIKNINSGTEDIIKLSKKIKKSKLAIIHECGHVPQEECPYDFFQAVDKFISDISGR